MTDKEYQQKKRECWADYTRASSHEGRSAYGAFLFAFDRAFALGKQERDADTVIQGWVCRDKDGELTLFYGSNQPKRKHEDDYWRAAFGYTLDSLQNDLFPDLTWNDEPQEVEIIIKRKKK